MKTFKIGQNNPPLADPWLLNSIQEILAKSVEKTEHFKYPWKKPNTVNYPWKKHILIIWFFYGYLIKIQLFCNLLLSCLGSSRQEALEGSHIIRYMYCFVGNFWTLSFFASTICYIVQECCRGLTTEFLDCWEFANLNIQGRRVNGLQTSILAT